MFDRLLPGTDVKSDLKLEKAGQELLYWWCYWQECYETFLSEHYDRRIDYFPCQGVCAFDRYCKGQLSESALFNKMGQLVTEQHFIVKDPKIADATAVKMVKPFARQ